MAIIDEIISAGSHGYKVSEPLAQDEARSLGLPIITPLNDVLERKYKQYVINDPDAAAARIWNAKKIGVPRWIQDFDEMYKKEAEARIALKDKGIPDFKSMVSFNPLTADFLSHDDAMEIAHDDSDALIAAESAARGIRNVTRGFGSARSVMSSRQKDLKQLKIGEFKDITPVYPTGVARNKANGNFIDNLSFVHGFKSGHEMAAIGNEAIALLNKESFGKMPGEAAWVNLDKRLLALDREEPDGWFSGMFYELGKQVGQHAQGAVTIGAMSTLGAALGAVAAVPVAGQALAAAGMTAMAGWMLGTRMGIFAQSAKVESGLDIIQRRRMHDENGKFLNPAAVAIASMTVGSINGALELAQVETVFSPIGKTRIVNKVASKIAKMSSFKKMAGLFAKDVIMNDVTESFTEVLQDLMPIAADEFEKAVFLGGNEQRSIGDITAQLRDTFTQSLYVFALPSLIGPVGAGVRGDYRAALYSKQAEAMQTQYINRTLDNFSNKIHAAKIIKRIPGMSREFADNLLTDADVSKVYVPAKSLNVLFQEGKLNGDYESAKDWAADLFDVAPEQFEESIDGGPEIEIEAAKLFADMDDSIVELLRPDMRFSRDGLTMKEAEAVNKRVEDLTTGQLFDTTVSAEREAKELESTQVLFESKRMELEAAGRDPESARVDAISMAYMYRSLTSKYNELRKTDMLPHEFARLYPLQIVRGDDGRVGIYLQSIGEKGAAELDAFSGVTERLDGLALARRLESEGFDAITEWQKKLNLDNDKWNFNVENQFAGFKSGQDVFLMNYPAVLSLVSPIDNCNIYFSYDKIKMSLKKHVQELDEASFKNLPDLIANPVMIFRSSIHSTNNNSLVVVLEMQGKNGASLLVPISLNKKNSRARGDYYIASSLYTQSVDSHGKRIANSRKYNDWVGEGLLLYADTDKLSKWKKINAVDFYVKEETKKEKVSSVIQRVQFPGRGRKAKPSGYIIKTQSDLVNARRNKPTFYQALKAGSVNQTKTDSFKDWFGDWENDPDNASKVVDKKGRPLVVYHGTGEDFNEFRKDKLGSRETAFFFTSNKRSAQEYGGKLMPVFLNAKRFVRLDENYRDANGIYYNVESEEFKRNFDGYSVDEGTDYDEFVIFDPTNIKSATGNEGTFDSGNPNIYHQTRGGTYRGALIPPNEAGMGQPAFLMLGNAADASTVMHETAHFYFSVMRSIAADYGSISDLDIIADWTRENAKECAAWTAENYDRFEHVDKTAITEEAFVSWLEDSESVSPELGYAFGVAQQEYFARGFEAYLREGKAPTAELRGVFQRFKRWLCDIYRSLTELRVNLSDDARGVFDRMLASEEAIESYRFEQDAALEADLDIDIGDIAIFDDEDIYAAAKERLLGELLDDVTPERINEMIVFAETQRPAIAAEVAGEPLYAMLREMQTDESLRINTGDILVFGGNDMLAKMPDGSVSYSGMPFEMAVKNYGFSSAAEMVESLTSLRSEKDEVDARVRFKVAAKYPDAMSSPDKMDYAVFKALYTGDERQDEVAADIVNSRNLIEEYDKYREIYAADEAAHAAEDNPGSRPNVLAWIKKNGKIKYSVVKDIFGAEPANELRLKLGPGVFAKDGFGLDELAQALNSEGVPIDGDQGLFNLLMGENPEKSPIDAAYEKGAADERAKRKEQDQARAEKRREAEGAEKSKREKKRAEKATWRAAQEQLRRDTSKAIKDSLKKPAQEAAKNIVGTFTINAIFDKKNLLGYVKAEKNARRDAEKALRKKDEQGFKDNKQIELRNNAIVREIYKQRTRAEYLRAWLDRYAQRKAKQTFGMSVPFIEQVDAIITRFDLKKLKYTKIADRTAEVPVKSLKEFIGEQEEQGVAMLIPDWISQSNVRIHYSQLRLQQMEDIRNSIANILKVGRDDKQTIAAAENIKIDEIAADILSHAYSFFGKKKTITGTRILDARRDTSKLDVVCDFLSNNETAEAICRALDGYKDMGPMYKYVFNPIRQALARETLDLNDVFGRLRELHEKCYGNVKISDNIFEIGVPMYKKSQMLIGGKLKDVFTPTKDKQLFDREMIVCSILNMGNEQNISRLKMGWGWTDADLRVILDKATEEDIKYVQGVWDILETMWPKVKYVSDLMTGRTLDKVEAKSLLTKFGELRGGYYPIITDLRYSERNAARAEKNEALASKPLDHAAMHTVSGQRKARGIDVPGSPPLLSFSVLDNHVANTVHDYLLAPAVRDARKILKNDRVSNVISEALGDRYNRNLNRWLNDVAANTKNNGISMSGGSLLCSKLRSGTSMYLLGGNIGGALMQPLGYLPLALRIGPINAVRALLNLKPETYRIVYEKSEFMRSEMDGTNHEVRRLRQNWSSHGKGLNRASSAFLEIYPFFQNMCNVPGWYVSYQLGLEKFATEAEAVAYADGVIRQTQSSSSVADLTDFERSGPLGQLLTMFYSWYRVMYQMQTEAIRKAKYGEGVSRFSSLASYSLYVLIAQEVANALLRNTGPDDDDDDKESSTVERWVRWTAGRCFQGLFASTPIVRDVISDNQYGYRFTPATAGLESLWKLIVKAEKEFDKISSNEEVDTSGLVFDTARVAGFATGMPNNALLRAARAFWEAYDEDKAIPWAYLFLGGGYRPKD